jgi:hypothetical protein
LMSPLGWSVHATIGAVFLAGSIGVLVSLLVTPPPIPVDLELQDAVFEMIEEESEMTTG